MQAQLVGIKSDVMLMIGKAEEAQRTSAESVLNTQAEAAAAIAGLKQQLTDAEADFLSATEAQTALQAEVCVFPSSAPYKPITTSLRKSPRSCTSEAVL